MEYGLELSPLVDTTFGKMEKKEKWLLRIIDKKIKQIRQNPYHFKPLKGSMRGERRVHIETSFVLTYEIDEDKKLVRILDFDHHDKVYKT